MASRDLIQPEEFKAVRDMIAHYGIVRVLGAIDAQLISNDVAPASDAVFDCLRKHARDIRHCKRVIAERIEDFRNLKDRT